MSRACQVCTSGFRQEIEQKYGTVSAAEMSRRTGLSEFSILNHCKRHALIETKSDTSGLQPALKQIEQEIREAKRHGRRIDTLIRAKTDLTLAIAKNKQLAFSGSSSSTSSGSVSVELLDQFVRDWVALGPHCPMCNGTGRVELVKARVSQECASS